VKIGTKARLDRLAVVAIPTGCHHGGGWCVPAWHIRSESEDPENPPPDTTCPRCGRGRLVREIVIVGADAAMIAAL